MPNTNEAWSEEEDVALARLYPCASQTELMQAFPRFSWYRICDRGNGRGIRRAFPLQGRVPINLYHRTMTWQNLESAANLVQEPAQKERMREIANALAKETLRGGLSAHWWLPLNDSSYVSDFDTMEDMLNGYPLAYGSHHPGESPRH